jgi:hypothetical protein
VNEAMQEFVNPLADLGDKVTKLTTELGMKAFRQRRRGGCRRGGLPARGAATWSSATSWPAWPRSRWTRPAAATRSTPPSCTTARFYFAKLLPETAGLIRSARSGVAPLMAMDEALF